jgi:hypothetical protein
MIMSLFLSGDLRAEILNLIALSTQLTRLPVKVLLDVVKLLFGKLG